MAFRNEEEEDDLFDQVSRMADRMGLQGEKREAYIDDHMHQGGYQRIQSRESYAKVQAEEEDAGGNRWGFGGRSRGGGGGRQNQGGQSGANNDTF